MATKSKQTKATKVESEFNLKDFKTQVETLVQRLMTYTLRNTSLEAAVPTEREAAEQLYEQILQGFAVLSEVDHYIGTKTNELARYMSRLTENHHKLNTQVDVEPEPAAEENLAGSEVNNDDNSEEEPPVEEKKSKSKSKKQDSDEEEEPPVEEKKSKSKSKKQDSDEEEEPPVEEKKSKSKSKSKKQDSDEEEEPPVEEKKSKSKSKSKKQDSDEEEEEEKPKKSKGKKY
jgi:hypothetical protein